MPTVKIAFAQQSALAGAVQKNRNVLGADLTGAMASGVEVFVAPAHPLTGDAGDLMSEPGFAAQVRYETARLTSVFPDQQTSLDPDLTTFTSRTGVKVTFATVTDPTTLTSVANTAATTGTQVLAISAALPYQIGGAEARRSELVAAATRLGMAIVFCNRVGGADEHVYDGGSLLISPEGTVVYQAPLFTPHLGVVEVDLDVVMDPQNVTAWLDQHEQTWTALVVGTRDYVRHNGFEDVVIGLSGGLDSAIVAAIAVDALGPNHVHGIGMPGPYSSDHSVTDAETLAANLGIRFDLVSIKDTYEAEVAALGDLLDGPGAQVAKENIQARLRSLHLFTVANARNALVLNTCNKSEDAVGYATVGGDAMGAYAPLADVPKTLAYRLANWRNLSASKSGTRPPIPDSTITKPPSAELAPGQQDTDTLPPYDILDTIIDRYLTRRDTADQIVAYLRDLGADAHRDIASDVGWVLKMIDRSEWKRQQAPLGPQVTAAPFAARRVPVTNGRVHHLTDQ